jgi:hypothetical protein
MSEAALALVEQPGENEKPTALMQRATDVASVCKAVVVGLAIDIKGKRYLPVEAWATIAATYGCAPSIREVVEEERGVRAVAELRKHDGSVIACAEGFVGLDEPEWANRPLYARRSMAQTRSISRVCRTAFAFVVTLMDAGLETTPAEEMPRSAAAVVEGAVVSPLSRPAANGKASPERSKATQVRFGKSKGKHLCDIEDSDLQWQLAAARKSVEANDPKWGQQNQAWLATVEAEAARRRA